MNELGHHAPDTPGVTVADEEDLPGGHIGFEGDVAVSDRRVIALKHERAGGRGIREDRSVGVSDDGLVRNDGFTIEDDGGMSINDGDLIALPLPTGLACILGWSDASENGTHALDSLHAAVSIDDLGLVGSAHVNSAVSSLGHIEFEAKSAISEGALRAKIAEGRERVEGLLWGFVDEGSIDHFPAVFLSRIGELPAVKVPAIEKGKGRTEFDFVEVRFFGEGRK